MSVRAIEFLTCPHCGDGTVVRLPDDWQAQVEAGASVPIIGNGCGNPWHYATTHCDGCDGWTPEGACSGVEAVQ